MLEYVELGCRVVLALVLVSAVVGKARSAASARIFVATLADVGWLPVRLRTRTAYLVVLAEAVTAVLLVVPATATAGLALAALVFGCFTAVLAESVWRGRPMGCACFGGAAEQVGASHVVRAVVLIAIAATGSAARLAAPASPTRPAGILATLALAGFAALLVVRWTDLAFILMPRAGRS
jgi:hypothetical protein